MDPERSLEGRAGFAEGVGRAFVELELQLAIIIQAVEGDRAEQLLGAGPTEDLPLGRDARAHPEAAREMEGCERREERLYLACRNPVPRRVALGRGLGPLHALQLLRS